MGGLFKNFYVIIIACLVGVIIVMQTCTSPPTPEEPTIITKVDTVWKKTKDSIVYKPGPTKVIPGPTITVNTPVDTTAILKDFFAKYVYKDSIKIDSFGYVNLVDTVSLNKIQSRKVVRNYSIPIIHKRETIIYPCLPKRQVFAGVDLLAGGGTSISHFGGSLILKDKKDHLYSIGAGINEDAEPQYRFSIAWKIKIK